jgi:hypothetical protein
MGLPGLAALAILLTVSVGSSGAEVAASACPPPALPSAGATSPATAPAGSIEPAPEQVLVCAGSDAIDGATYLHWLMVAKKGGALGGHAPSATELQNEVLGFLISSDWVKGEAQDLHLSVSAAEVRKTFDHIRNQQFHKRREFNAFLRDSGQTVADLLFRVELNLLSQRIQKHVVAGNRSAAGKQHALSQFVKAFKVKWQAQTYCAAQYAVADCGHVQATV